MKDAEKASRYIGCFDMSMIIFITGFSFVNSFFFSTQLMILIDRLTYETSHYIDHLSSIVYSLCRKSNILTSRKYLDNE